jgi:hypothetical protein
LGGILSFCSFLRRAYFAKELWTGVPSILRQCAQVASAFATLDPQLTTSAWCQMIMPIRVILCVFLLFAPLLDAQENYLERPASDFRSSGAGLTETLLMFAHQQNLRIAIEYVDRDSMRNPSPSTYRTTRLERVSRQFFATVMVTAGGRGMGSSKSGMSAVQKVPTNSWIRSFRYSRFLPTRARKWRPLCSGGIYK